jgi:hypothetical protein
MALQLTTTTPQGFTATDAYHRVENISLHNKNSIVFSISSYKDNLHTNLFKSEIKHCDYDLNGENPIKQAYLHLKTLPDFADAVDC